jgi:hypothetical protein
MKLRFKSKNRWPLEIKKEHAWRDREGHHLAPSRIRAGNKLGDLSAQPKAWKSDRDFR